MWQELACRNEFIAREVEKLWTARFVQKYELTFTYRCTMNALPYVVKDNKG